MKLFLTVALMFVFAMGACGGVSANSIDYYNHYGSNCETPSHAC